MRRAASLLCLAGALLATLGLAPARGQGGGPVVEGFEASGVLDARVLGALRRDLDGARRRGARVVLVQLSSFGGLGVDPAEVRRTVADAKVPGGVWGGPRAGGARGGGPPGVPPGGGGGGGAARGPGGGGRGGRAGRLPGRVPARRRPPAGRPAGRRPAAGGDRVPGPFPVPLPGRPGPPRAGQPAPAHPACPCP